MINQSIQSRIFSVTGITLLLTATILSHNCVLAAQEMQEQPKVLLNYEEALKRVWLNSPTLMIADDEVGVKQSEEYQAGRLPNPVASIQIDGANSFGSSKRHCRDRETFYSLSQLIELGGKRSARKDEAAFLSSLAMWDKEMLKLDVINELTKAMVDVAAAQETVILAKEQQRIANEIITTVNAKIQSGKEVVLKARKAEMAKAKATLLLNKSYRYLELSKKKLASLWGSVNVDFEEVSFPLFNLDPIPNVQCLVAKQQDNLSIQWNMQISAAEKAVTLEKAQRIPDVVVTAGYMQSNGSGNGLVLGFQMPIPIFDHNSGNINRAKLLLCQIYERQRENLLESKIELEESYEDLLTAYNESLTFRNTILSTAKENYEASHDGYQHGKYDYLELLDSQRTLFEEQEDYINKLVEYHHKKADVDRLVSSPIENKINE